jgi:hypothetical protein
MKKISMFFAALAVAVSSFAATTAPTASDLLDYYEQGQLCVCVYFEAEVCNDVVFIGTYNNWDSSDPTTMAKFAPLPGFEGWYYVAVTDTCANIEGKPVQLAADGSFAWENQTGDAASWELVSGNVNIEAGYAGEANLKGYSTAEPVILISKYFKNEVDICSYVAEYKDYTIRLNAPWCAGEDGTYFEPAIIGAFNSWSEGVLADEIDEEGYYVFNLKQAEKTKAFKFRATTDTEWKNQIQLPELDEEGNIVLDENGVEKWYDNPDQVLGDETTITLDYSMGRYTLCVDAETAVEDVVVEKTAVKTIKDGQLVIEMNGKLFNILGAEVK